MIVQRFTIEGRVQGVGYRAFVVQMARSLGINGWVCNRNDGSVEILAQGPAPIMERFIAACRHGPPLADVRSISGETSGETVPDGFTERPTA